jgi:hypothetical protein
MRFDTLDGFFNFLPPLDFVLLAICRFSCLKFPGLERVWPEFGPRLNRQWARE